MSEGRVLAAVAAGGALGSLGRWLVALVSGDAAWGTLLVNVTGALALGLLVARLEVGGHHPLLRPFLATGLLGGWTTYSTFALDVHALTGAHFAAALGYVVATLAVATTAALGGMVAGERLWGGGALVAGRVAEDEL